MKIRTIIGLVVVAVIVAALGLFLYARNQKPEDHTSHTAARADTTEHEGQTMADTGEKKPAGSKKILYYRDPMHPAYTSPKPGTAPDCGMELVPVYEGEEEVSVTVPGLATVTINPERQQLIGVKTGIVARQRLDKTIRTVGRVDYDERRLAHVHTKIEGWIQRLYVDYTGQLVQKGQPLLAIYSPDLVATQEEYLLALKGRQTLTKSRFSDVVSGSQSLVESARRRLQLWDISDAQIAQLEQTGKPQTTMTLYAPFQGFVVEKMAFEGKKIDGSEDLYLIADLSDVWVYADIYEYELPLVKVGQPAVVTLTYEPGKTFTGKVVYIYPALDPMTRTAKVRLEFPNPGWTLKPQMYTNVEIRTGQGEGLVVPDGAVLDSGTRQIVFVDKGGGRFEPREVKVGMHLTGAYEVFTGLQEGERVITSANFLIDSESQLKAAIGQMGMPGMKH